MRSMSGSVRSWSWAMLPALVACPQHGGLGDDGDVGVGGHLLLEALLDVEGVGVARVAEDLEHLALGRAVLLGEQAHGLVGRDVADLDGAGDGGEVGRRRDDLPVEDHHRNAGGLHLLDAGLGGVEIDRGEDHRRGLEVDDVVDLVELRGRLVLAVERDHLVADILHERGDGVDRAGLELVEQRRHQVVDLALHLLRRRGADRERGERRVPATAPFIERNNLFMSLLPFLVGVRRPLRRVRCRR